MKAIWTRRYCSIDLVTIALVFLIAAGVVKFRFEPSSLIENAGAGRLLAGRLMLINSNVLGHDMRCNEEHHCDSWINHAAHNHAFCSLRLFRRGSRGERRRLCVAILLEVARLLKQNLPGENGVLCLFTDGEEAGLLGARAFLKLPLAKHIAAAINAEAQGTSGESTVLEIGNASGWLVNVFAKMSKHPLANSLVSTTYKILSNNRDFTVFQSFGMVTRRLQACIVFLKHTRAQTSHIPMLSASA